MIDLTLQSMLVIDVRHIVKGEKTFCVVKALDRYYDVYELFFAGDSSVTAQTLRKGESYEMHLGLVPAYRGSGFSYELLDVVRG